MSMKKLFFTALFFLMFMAIGQAQTEKIKVVFDVTSASPQVHRTAIRHLNLMSNAYPDSQFQLVMYSGAGMMATAQNPELTAMISEAVQRDNTRIVLCKATMNKLKLEKEDLIPGVESVPDGILEIAVKQAQGWAYIKEGLNANND